MLSKFRIQNFKCLADVSLDLGPFNVLIGPNDSGKTSVVEALDVLQGLLSSPAVANALNERGLSAQTVLRHGTKEALISFDAGLTIDGHEVSYSVGLGADGKVHRETLQGLPQRKICYDFPGNDPTHIPGPSESSVFLQRLKEAKEDSGSFEALSRIRREIQSLQYTFDPREMSKPSEPAQGPDIPKLEPTGQRLPSVLDYLLLVERDRFDQIQSRLCQLVPYIRQIRISPVGGKRQIAFVTSQSPEPIPAPMASDGLLLFLGYLTLLYLPQTSARILVVEEPENGIHPRRLEEVVRLLRELTTQENVQVIMTTHSPYLLDWVEAEEVHILTRGDDLGTRATRMSAIPDIDVLRKGYQLGELWFNYGEAELVGGVK